MEKKVEILYDHYKDTFEHQKKNLIRRNYYSLICLGIVFLFSFQIQNPEQTTLIAEELIKKNIVNLKIDFNFINNILTFSFLWIIMLYYQIIFLIEKQYFYLQNLEENISKETAPYKITRESKTYLENYPILSSLIHRIFTILVPILLSVVSYYKFKYEKSSLTEPLKNGHFLINAIFLIMVIVASLLFLSFVHFKDFKKKSNGRIL
jgi:hypothetical protein